LNLAFTSDNSLYLKYDANQETATHREFQTVFEKQAAKKRRPKDA